MKTYAPLLLLLLPFVALAQPRYRPRGGAPLQWDIEKGMTLRGLSRHDATAAAILGNLPTAADVADELEARQEYARRLERARQAAGARAQAEIDAREAFKAREQAVLNAERDAVLARPATPNSGGIMVRGGKAVIVPGAAFPSVAKDSLPVPMHGFQWAFPSRPNDQRVIRRDSLGLKDEAYAKMDADSRAKVKARYPFLADKSDERVKKLND